MIHPLITIGITCYNAEKTILSAINSAINQDWPNFEIIIVDDFSTDGSVKIIDEVKNKSNISVRVIRHQRNKRYAEALNTIIKNSAGEFIVFFDDDDVSSLNRLTSQYNRIINYEKKNNTTKILCYTYRNIIKVGENKIDHIAKSIGGKSPEPWGPFVANYFLKISNIKNSFDWGDGVLGSCTLMSRKSNFILNDGFDKNFRRGAEIDFAVRASFRNFHFISCDTPLVTMKKTESLDKSIDIDYQSWKNIF